MAKQIFCSICSRPVQDGEARYYFPTLAAQHPLALFSGIAHVECLRREDEKLSIGTQLSDIRESMARMDSSERHVRDGNVVLRGRIADEKMVEIYDGEDFCDFSLKNSVALKLMAGGLDKVTSPLFRLVSDEDRLTYTNLKPSFTSRLEMLTTSRLRELLRKFLEMPDNSE